MQTLEFRADDITVLKSEFCPATRCLIDLAAFFTFAFFLKMFILSALHFLLLSMPLLLFNYLSAVIGRFYNVLWSLSSSCFKL